MITKNDYFIAALIGFLVGVFAIPTAVNLGVRNYLVLFALPVVLPFLWVLGLWLGALFSRWISFMTQVVKFAVVGFLNTAIDFGILNILSRLTETFTGFVVGGVNVPGFIAAVFNSYFWNKFWVFRGREGMSQDFVKFFVVTLVGLGINSGIVILVTTYIPPSFGMSEARWLNVAKVLATGVSMVWNFMGYKFLVFRTQDGSLPLPRD